MVAAQKGIELPEGCFLGPDGLPTRDPAAVLQGGFLLPIADHKGYGLALCIALLTGVLAGGLFDTDILHPYKHQDQPGNNSYLMLALRVDCFTPAAEFKRRVDQVVQAIHSTPPAAGVERVWAPGEREFEVERERRANGIPLAEGTVREMRDLAAQLDVELEF